MNGLPQPRFTTHPLVLLAISLAAGIVLFTYFNRSKFAIIFTIGAALVSITATIVWRRQSTILTFLLIAFVGTGYFLAFVELRAVSGNRLRRMFETGALVSNQPVEVTGNVEGEPEAAPDGFYLTLTVEQVRAEGKERSSSGKVLLLAHVADRAMQADYDALELHHGARIRLMTLLDRDEDYRNPGVAPFTEYLERRGYDATGVIKSPLLVERLADARVCLPLALLFEWRSHLAAQFDRHFSPETAGVLDAVLLGNRYKVSRAVADRFREGGAFHVLVIAGLHISFIAGLLFLFMRQITHSRTLRFATVVTILFAYSLAVGGQPPVVRAALVFTLGILAPLVWRRAKSLNVIAAAALVLLIWRPSDLFDPSFQLTFLSVISIVTLAVPLIDRMQRVGAWRPTHETPYPPSAAPWFRALSEILFWSECDWKIEMVSSNIRYRLFKHRWATRLERWHLQKPVRFAAGGIIVSAAVQIGMLPLLIIYFHRISFASLVLNIFVGMAMAVLALVCLMGTVIAQLSTSLASPVIFVAERIEWLMVHAIDPITHMGIASVRLPHYHGTGMLVYGLYFLSLGVLIFALRRWNPLRPAILKGAANDQARRFLIKLGRVAFVLLLPIVVLHPFSAGWPDGRLRVDFLDVGQGDAALVTMPDGATLLIDGGGRPNIDWKQSEDTDEPFERDTRTIGERVVSEFLWSRGLDRVDYILPTHADADHIDGLNDVARNFKVRAAVVSRTPVDNAEYTRFAETMKKADVAIQTISAGDVLRFGEVSFDVLWPVATADVEAPWRNNDGTVLRLRYRNQTILFTADIEKEPERAILNEGADLNSNIVKVAHHGSRTSSTQNFINATQASVVIISVGRTSIFGHPNQEVLDRWRASGAQVMTTGEKGTISVVTDGQQLTVSTFVQ